LAKASQASFLRRGQNDWHVRCNSGLQKVPKDHPVEAKVPQFATLTSKRRNRVGVKSVIAILVAGVLVLGWLAYVGWLVLKARSLM
jgi:hypothetical protein